MNRAQQIFHRQLGSDITLTAYRGELPSEEAEPLFTTFMVRMLVEVQYDGKVRAQTSIFPEVMWDDYKFVYSEWTRLIHDAYYFILSEPQQQQQQQGPPQKQP